MKVIQLTKGKHTIVDDDDFEVLSQYKWHYSGDSSGYARRYIKGSKNKSQSMQNEILGISGEIDHINNDKLDNRKCNLRPATRQQQQRNRKKYLRNGKSHSKYKGLFYRNNRNTWRAVIYVDKKPIYIGSYKTEEEAALAYNQKAIELFGEFANLNIIENCDIKH